MPQIIITGNTDIIDNFMDKGTPTNNNGGSTTLVIGNAFGGAFIYRGLLKNVFTAIPSGVVINSAQLQLKISSVNANNGGTLKAYRSKRAWEEASSTWNNWKTGNTWTTAGAGSTANDRESTELGSVVIPASTPSAGDIITMNLDSALIQEFIDGIFTNNGYVLKMNAETGLDGYTFHSSEAAVADNRPKIVVNYSFPQNGSPMFFGGGVTLG